MVLHYVTSKNARRTEHPLGACFIQPSVIKDQKFYPPSPLFIGRYAYLLVFIGLTYISLFISKRRKIGFLLLLLLSMGEVVYGQEWNEIQKLLASDGASGDWFGGSVSLSGSTAIVGAWLDDDKGPGSGSAYLYVLSPDSVVVRSPVNGASFPINEVPAFTWASSTLADDYTFQLSEVDSFTTLVASATIPAPDTTYTLAEGLLQPTPPYYWRVQAENEEGGISDWSAVHRFTTLEESPEATISITTPSDIVEEEGIAYTYAVTNTGRFLRQTYRVRVVLVNGDNEEEEIYVGSTPSITPGSRYTSPTQSHRIEEIGNYRLKVYVYVGNTLLRMATSGTFSVTEAPDATLSITTPAQTATGDSLHYAYTLTTKRNIPTQKYWVQVFMGDTEIHIENYTIGSGYAQTSPQARLMEEAGKYQLTAYVYANNLLLNTAYSDTFEVIAKVLAAEVIVDESPHTRIDVGEAFAFTYRIHNQGNVPYAYGMEGYYQRFNPNIKRWNETQKKIADLEGLEAIAPGGSQTITYTE